MVLILSSDHNSHYLAWASQTAKLEDKLIQIIDFEIIKDEKDVAKASLCV